MILPRRDDPARHEQESEAERIEEPSHNPPPGDRPIRLAQTPEGHPGGRTDTGELLTSGTNEEAPIFLVPAEEAARLRTTWNSIQTRFVDEPRGAVKEADALVADVIRRVTELFAKERSGLERQWSRGDNVSTEDLRLAMRRYRSFFDRLLSH